MDRKVLIVPFIGWAITLAAGIVISNAEFARGLREGHAAGSEDGKAMQQKIAVKEGFAEWVLPSQEYPSVTFSWKRNLLPKSLQKVTCSHCSGTGVSGGNVAGTGRCSEDPIPCEYCLGSGKVK